MGKILKNSGKFSKVGIFKKFGKIKKFGKKFNFWRTLRLGQPAIFVNLWVVVAVQRHRLSYVACSIFWCLWLWFQGSITLNVGCATPRFSLLGSGKGPTLKVMKPDFILQTAFKFYRVEMTFRRRCGQMWKKVFRGFLARKFRNWHQTFTKSE